MIPFDRVKYAATSLVNLTTTADGVWAPIELPRRPASSNDVITAKLVRFSQSSGRVLPSCEPTVLRWAIAAPTANSRIGISVAGVRFYADVGPAPTQTTARDALLAVLTAPDEARLLPSVTAGADGSDGIVLDSSGALGRLYCPVAIGPGTSISVTTDVDAEISTVSAAGILEFQAYAGGTALGAHALLAEMVAGLDSHDVTTMRHRLNIAFGGPAGDVVDLTALAGPKWESRASVRLPVSLRSYRAIAVDTVTAITANLDLRLDGANVGPQEITVP